MLTARRTAALSSAGLPIPMSRRGIPPRFTLHSNRHDAEFAPRLDCPSIPLRANPAMLACATGSRRKTPPTRAERFTLAGGGLAADFSKNRINDDTLRLLVQLARDAGVEARRDAMFAGEIVNRPKAVPRCTRAARSRSCKRRSMHRSAPSARRWRPSRAPCAAARGRATPAKRIRHVINIGIGGSDLGPKMVVHALHHVATPDITTHFVSNVDGADLARVLEQVDPEKRSRSSCRSVHDARDDDELSLRDWFVARGCPRRAREALRRRVRRTRPKS